MTAASPKADSVAKPTLVLMAGRMLAFAATFFIPVVLARVFNPVEFGTYKQLFLIQSTIFYIAQFGMGTTLYYFLPRSPSDAGRYVANSLACLSIAGVLGMAGMTVMASHLSQRMNNPALTPYLPWMGAYLALTMLAAPFEIVLIARSRYSWASAVYALTDCARALALILPAVLTNGLDWLVRGAVLMAGLRAAAALVYFRAEFKDTLALDPALMRRQWAYAFPFGIAVMIEILQGSLPQYLVSSVTTPAAFAIFAVGCLQIPLVDLATSPASDVMMVKMQENLAAGRRESVLAIWHDTTWKLALLFIPLTVLVFVSAREIILFLYTAKYAASVPLFMVWSLLVLTSSFQVDGVLRVFAQTRLLLVLNVVRFIVLAGLIHVSIWKLQLLGPVVAIVLANAVFKLLALAQVRKLMGAGWRGLLPWRKLGSIVKAAAVAAGPVLFLKMQLHQPAGLVLLLITPVYIATYAAIIWHVSVLEEHERAAITNWTRRAFQTWWPLRNQVEVPVTGLRQSEGE